jgi:hypothetical protein
MSTRRAPTTEIGERSLGPRLVSLAEEIAGQAAVPAP